MSEGGLEAPVRHPIPWREDAFYDRARLDAETRRIFDICHGCRRCFNLCDSFPRLFDLIDDAESGELDTVESVGFQPVIDACTLCDMCFLTKCPYVPPHDFDLDFPHLMLRHRAVELKEGKIGAISRQLSKTDRNGKLGCALSPIANWATRTGNRLTRPVMEMTAGIHRDAALPEYAGKPFTDTAKLNPPPVNRQAPAFGRKAVLYATCFANYNNTAIAEAALKVLALNGVETEVVYPACCGMPQLEHGDIAQVAKNAEKTAAELKVWIKKGYDVIGLVSSCVLMFKFEWPLIVPENEDVKRLSAATYDIAEYVVHMAGKEGLTPGLKPLGGDVTVHISCHSRAQNMGQKATELLKLLPDTNVSVIERCSGHGGSWGIMKDNFEVAMKLGRAVARQAVKNGSAFVVSECPLAREHMIQGMECLDVDVSAIGHARHPIQLLALAYGQ